MSDTQRNVLCLALTFRKKGLRLSNPDIAEILNRHSSTVNKAIIYLRDHDLIEIKNPQSRYRAIFPAKGKRYLSGLKGTVDDTYLTLFANLLDPPEGYVLIPPRGSTKGKKEYNKREFSSSERLVEESELVEPTGASDDEIQKLIEGGYLHG